MNRQKQIASIRAFLPDLKIENLINILQLSPVEDWTKWIDAEGNCIKIKKNKAIQIYLNKNPKQKTLDIFKKAKPETIAKNSYWAFVIIGQNKKLINFLGNDGVLRSCYFEDNIWKENINPIMLGIDNLFLISSNYLDSDYKELTNINIDLFEVEKAFYTSDIKEGISIW